MQEADAPDLIPTFKAALQPKRGAEIIFFMACSPNTSKQTANALLLCFDRQSVTRARVVIAVLTPFFVSRPTGSGPNASLPCHAVPTPPPPLLPSYRNASRDTVGTPRYGGSTPRRSALTPSISRTSRQLFQDYQRASVTFRLCFTLVVRQGNRIGYVADLASAGMFSVQKRRP